MTTFLRSSLFIAALTVGATGLMSASVSTDGDNIKQLVKLTKTLEATAETPAQHRTLAADYHELAQRQIEESNTHAEQAAWYARFPIYSSEKLRRSTIDHCEYFAEKYRKDAQKSEDLAARHERLAS
jgi:hypothetical protein